MKLSHRRQFLHLAAGAAALPAVSRFAWAQTYPSRPVRLIVPYAAGGGLDIVARLIAQKLSEHLGKQFFVENIGGAGGNIGTVRGARAGADGYTMVVVASPFIVNPILNQTVPYDPIKDFDPVALAVAAPVMLAVNPSLPVRTVNDLVTLIRANPGKYSYASGGTGTRSQLTAELFKQSLKLDLVHVPFNGAGPAVLSALAGHTPVFPQTPPTLVQHVKDGTLRALAVMSKARSRTLPDVPTMAEAGYPGIEGEEWYAVVVPAGTPKEIIRLLNREIVGIIAREDISEPLAKLGFEPVSTMIPEELAGQFKAETEKWGKVIRAAKIKAQ
jgi:tripartite-type tricarboxylate transporter receptor subunit TctC